MEKYLLTAWAGSVGRGVFNMAVGAVVASGEASGIPGISELPRPLVGGVGVVMIGWGLYKHYRSQMKIQAALTLPAGSSRETLETRIKESR